MYLPATDDAPTQQGESTRLPAIEAGDERGVVLVVEDNAAVRALVTRSIERLGFDVVAAQNGPEARSWIEGREIKFEALVSDIVMPGSSGLDVARVFREHYDLKRIVLMSGYAEDEIGPVEHLPKDIRFVQKPLTSKALAEALTT